MTFEEIMITEEDADMFLLDEFDNDDTEDVSLVENQDIKIKVEPLPIDVTVPPGWRYKRKSKKLVSPKGKVFRSRRGALKAMVNSSDYSMNEIEEMRSLLRHEGWRESDDLPRCWMIRDGRKKHGSELLGPGGEFFTSLKRAAMFIINYEEYFYSEDLDNFWKFANISGIKKEDFDNIAQNNNNEVLFENGESDENKQASSTLQPGDTSNHEVYRSPSKKVLSMKRDGSTLSSKWKSAETSLPKGWMSKECSANGVKLLRFRSPTGKVLPGTGIRSVLKFMIQNSFPSDHIKKTRSLMTSEGWQEFDMLPSRWMYKLHKGKYGKSLLFLDTDANLYKSKEEVKRHFNQHQDLESLSKFEEFLKSRPQGSYYKAEELDDGWLLGDPSIPSGWRIRKRIIGGSVPGTQLLTPDNKCLDGRRSALKFMVKNNYPEEEKKLMRKGLMTHNEWLTDPQIPESWLYKCTKDGRKSNFIDSEGNLFNSQLEVLKFYKDDQHIVNLLKQFFNIPVIHHIENEEGWRKNDPSVPSGWSIKDRKDGHSSQLLSPEGFLHLGRKAALRHLVKNNYPEEQVQEMRHSLAHEGWSVADGLPYNWLFRRDKKRNIYEFVSPDASFYKSSTAAIRYLEESNFTADKEILEKFCQQLQRNERIEDDSWTKDDSIVPSGWKTKEYKIGNVSLHKFISPDGHIFTSRTSALKFMFDHNESFCDNDVNNMRVLLQKHEKWYSDPQLPTDWLYKKSKTGMSFISDRAEFLKSREAALRHLEEKNKLQEGILLRGFISSVQRNDRIEDNNWNLNDQTVPPGWKTKHKQNGRRGSVLVLISPDGELCMGRKTALKYMIENKNIYSGSEVDEMRSLIQVHDGWLADKDLPCHWLYKEERNARLSFLDSFGNHYRSKELLFATLSKDILGSLRNFLDKKGVSCLGQDAWISNDPSLPPGWKIRKLEQEAPVKDKVKALLSSDKISSPDGHIFAGKAHAYRHMIKKNYPGEDLAIMRNGLLADGWFEDPDLPQNWLAKKKADTKFVKSSRFMDEKGNILKSLAIASMFLTKEGRSKDIEKLKTFYESWKRPNNPEKPEDKEIESNCWENFKKVSGWKRKIDDSGREHFMSPCGDYIKGRFRLIKYMKEKDKNGESTATLKEMFGHDKNPKMITHSKDRKNHFIEESEREESYKKNRREDDITDTIDSPARKRGRPKKVGWFRFKEEALSGWKYKIDEAGTPGPGCYKSPSGDTFMGRLNVLKYMKENDFEEKAVLAMKKRFRQEDVKLGMAENKREKGKSKTVVKTDPEIRNDPTDDETLKNREGNRKSPSGWNTFEDAALSGWKFKSDKPGMSGHCRYLSPDGDYLNGRLQVLKFMKDNNVGEDTIVAMRKTFRTATKELFLNKLP